MNAKAKETVNPKPVETVEPEPAKLLQQIIENTQTTGGQELARLGAAIESFLRPEVEKIKVDDDVEDFIDTAVKQIEGRVSDQMNEIVHHADFQSLEAKWRGVEYLVEQTDLGEDMKLYGWNVSPVDLTKDMKSAKGDLIRSRLFNVLFRQPLGQLGGQPFNFVVWGHGLTNSDDDMALLDHVGQVAEQGQTVVFAAPSPQFFGVSDFTKLESHPAELKKVVDGHTAWKAFRGTKHARHVGLVMPRYLARLPYGSRTKVADGVEYFEEHASGKDLTPYLWGNAAYLFGQRVAASLAEYGWPAQVTGFQGGGKITNLKPYAFSPGGQNVREPVDINIDGMLEPTLAEMGFISLRWEKGTANGVFQSAPSAHKPKQTNNADVNAKAEVASRLPVMLAICRVGHYVNNILNRVIGAMWQDDQIKTHLDTWVDAYTIYETTSPEIKAKQPLRKASFTVLPHATRPGYFVVELNVEPWIGVEGFQVAINVMAPDTRPQP